MMEGKVRERKTIHIIDDHVHIGRDERYKIELTPREFIKKMKRNGVDYAIIFPCPWTKTLDYIKENQYVMKVSRRSNNLFPALFVNPLSQKSIDGARAICKEEEIRALKLHPSANKYSPKEILKTDVIAIAEDFRLPLIIHSGHEKKYKEILEIAQRFPNQVIVAHAFRFKEILVKEAGKISNVYLDPCPFITLLNAKENEKILFGNLKELLKPAKEKNPKILFKRLYEIMNGRILWGSDEPWSSRLSFAVSYDEEVAFIKNLNLRIREKIMENSQKIFQIPD